MTMHALHTYIPELSMKRAYTLGNIMNMRYQTLPWTGPWAEAFGTPEDTGIWLIWGHSGNGKTSFALQLAKELSKYGRVAFNSLEMGFSLSLQSILKKVIFSPEEQRNFILLNESMPELEERLTGRRPPRFVIIDSFQYTQFTLTDYMAFKERHANTLIIFLSQADGRTPTGRTAHRVMFDADLKVWVEGFRAISKGRSIGPVGYMDIWPEAAQRHWGNLENT